MRSRRQRREEHPCKYLNHVSFLVGRSLKNVLGSRHCTKRLNNPPQRVAYGDFRSSLSQIRKPLIKKQDGHNEVSLQRQRPGREVCPKNQYSSSHSPIKKLEETCNPIRRAVTGLQLLVQRKPSGSDFWAFSDVHANAALPSVSRLRFLRSVELACAVQASWNHTAASAELGW